MDAVSKNVELDELPYDVPMRSRPWLRTAVAGIVVAAAVGTIGVMVPKLARTPAAMHPPVARSAENHALRSHPASAAHAQASAPAGEREPAEVVDRGGMGAGTPSARPSAASSVTATPVPTPAPTLNRPDYGF